MGLVHARATAALARLVLVAAAHLRLAVTPALRRALALVLLRGRLLANLVGVVLHLASIAGLLVAWILVFAHGVSCRS